LARGIVETVEDPGVVDGEKVHCLPHHAVVRRNRTTTKVRVVFDASARSNGPSLNDCLHVGPRFNQMILGILLRNPDEEPPVTQVLRYARVVFGVNRSPFLLKATIRHHSIYVDDSIGGADTEEGVWKLYCDYKRILSEGGFNLHKYIASGSVIDTYVIMNQHLTEQKVLGIRWKVKEDALVFDIREVGELANVTGPTKRNVLAVGQIYDPLGILTPITIRLKIFLQELHKSRIGWDQQLTGDLLDRWRILVSELRRSNFIEIPRYYFKGSGGERAINLYQLCGFCDASAKAYAAVVYLLTMTDTGIRCILMSSKTRVPPNFTADNSE
uniref:Reverse transcriptase domain-containing protein n=1 Tax=Amphimedon queenslandica TaxID=400682 RepID=A0A1X7TLW9_AMPQE